MGRFVKGEVVVVPFPFSDLSQSKRCPALVLTNLRGDDVILCMISGRGPDEYAIPLARSDFETGALDKECHIRPNRVFTADGNIVEYSAGRLRAAKLAEVITKLVALLRN